MANVDTEKPWPINDDKATTSLLATLFAHYTHQNGLLYSRMNVALTLQVVGIAAGWTARRPWGGLALILAGAVTLALWQMTRRDRQCRDANLDLMRNIEEKLLPGKGWIADQSVTTGDFPLRIRVGTKPTSPAAGSLYKLLFFFFIGLDVLLAVASFCGCFGAVAAG